MTREIKFRGKRLDNGEWVYGYYSKLVKFVMQNGEDVCVIKDKIITVFGDSDGVTQLLNEVIPESVGQYTGLEDKNGKDIYEGDIIKVSELTFDSSGRLPENLNVVYYGGAFQLFRGKESLLGLHLLYIKEGEVIGNIHDNPELLGEAV